MTAPEKSILIYGEVRQGKIHPVTRELTGKGRELGNRRGGLSVEVLLLTDFLEDSPKVLFRGGADRVYLVEHPSCSQFNQEIAAKVAAALIREIRPEIVLAPATTSGRTVLPAVAALVGTGLTADCTELAIEEETGLLLQTRPAIGGNVMATIKTPEHRPQMATVRPRTFPIPPEEDRSGEVIRPPLPRECFESRIVPEGVQILEGEAANIQDMDVLISGGKGLRGSEGFELLQELAELLEGGVGASRQAVEAQWIGYPHQVGLSGKVVSPKLYLAAGISGAVQHLAGMQTAEYIVGINKDPEAPLFRVADLALCGDLYAILPRLIERIRKERGQ